ncbi:dnaJ homolog subfamily C member 17-like [Olea europaea var. sylvestris]|uniref:DnaJ homolog subfamily C member 17 n=1 Tax=Olea europaea subsp. europaea TaxID=158383 RepID=A0A8S0UKM0_OLEEU|nr:dnaJ homolog subfamily C member 17-like [Olea europaea var. sylvestris]CAA3016291.1 dnaJ homolog subfamily C member 17 [Olea europaea subsp. europaea]
MDGEIDHYVVLGLPSGEEGAKLSEKEITKAYRLKALELHPDKRPDDPNAHDNFQKLTTSYAILKDEKARKLFDDLLRVKREKFQRQSQQDSKRRKMMSDLEERERYAFAPDPSSRAREEEERIARKLKEEIARIRTMHSNKGSATTTPSTKDTNARGKSNMDDGGSGLNKEKVLKVSWEKTGEDYTAQRLREIFAEFGVVEDVVIKSSKKKGSALVVMGSKDAADAATGNVLGDLSNPLLVLPLQPASSPVNFGVEANTESDVPKLSNLVGAGYQAFEESVLDKLKKAAQRQK